jgi:hypothetical protein
MVPGLYRMARRVLHHSLVRTYAGDLDPAGRRRGVGRPEPLHPRPRQAAEAQTADADRQRQAAGGGVLREEQSSSLATELRIDLDRAGQPGFLGCFSEWLVKCGKREVFAYGKFEVGRIVG